MSKKTLIVGSGNGATGPDFVVLGDEPEVVVLRSTSGGGLCDPGELLVLGLCMAPTLLPGDRLRTRRIDGALRPGCIVSFVLNDRILTHRVIKVRGEMFWARGDVSTEVQGPVPVRDAIGRVVAYWRDGKWRSLEGARKWAVGMAYNLAMSRLVLAARRFPRLRRFVELDLLGSGLSRQIYRKLGAGLLGNITVEKESAQERVFATLMSSLSPGDGRRAELFEQGLSKGTLKLLVARFSPSRRRAGLIVLARVATASGVPAGWVTSLLVHVGYRGLGVGRALLEAAEKAAREDGLYRLLAQVRPENVRSLGLFVSSGYRKVEYSGANDELTGGTEPSHERYCFLEKNL